MKGGQSEFHKDNKQTKKRTNKQRTTKSVCSSTIAKLWNRNVQQKRKSESPNSSIFGVGERLENNYSLANSSNFDQQGIKDKPIGANYENRNTKKIKLMVGHQRNRATNILIIGGASEVKQPENVQLDQV